MFNLVKDKKGIVKQLTFNKPLERYYIPFDKGVIHEELAKQFAENNWNYFSVIVKTEQLEEKLWDDPKHAHKSYSVYCSLVQREAIEKAQGHFFSQEEVDQIFEDFQFPKERYNWKDEEKEKTHLVTEIIDAIYDAQVKMQYPAVIEEFKRECRYEIDEETGDEVKVPKDVFEKRWKKRQLEIFLPRVDEDIRRTLPNTPEPFGGFTLLAQYFFIEKEDKIEWASGSYAGSQTRYDFGLMGHLFATLTKKYNKTIPTYLFKNTKNNEFQYIEEWKTFKVDRCELTGNYPVRWENSEPLFEGLLFER